MRSLQPRAVIFSDVGPDVRWVGNERGFAGETCWGMISPAGYEPGLGAPPEADLTQGREDGTAWIPAECDVSIRPGWYYHPEQDGEVKSLEKLLEIWHASVGRGANLLLNLPVDRRGLVHERDVARLREWRAALDALYGVDLARGARASATNVRGGAVRFAASQAIDGDPVSYWATDDGSEAAALELEFDRAVRCDRVRLEEPLELGQRVRAFEIEARGGVDEAWETIARGTTIGARRIVTFPARDVRFLRVSVTSARACPALSAVKLFLDPAAR